MKIYQVEELVGITKKNIRFYEDQGLLCPNRNPQNDYREYSLDDVKSMMLVSIDSIPGKDFEVLGIVKGTIVQSKNSAVILWLQWKPLSAEKSKTTRKCSMKHAR
ncbi:MAG: MerR family transcriptional regulator [Treponema sp.]|nr:MerR family transcriptional regulator [Treponema sp.]